MYAAIGILFLASHLGAPQTATPPNTPATQVVANKVSAAKQAIVGAVGGKAQAKAADFNNKAAVVSGADGGIGLALCEVLLERNAQVFAGIHSKAPSVELQALQQRFPKALVVAQLDVTNDASVAAFRDQVTTPLVDVLINAAGVNVDEKHKLMEPMENRFDKTFAVNTLGPVRLTQAFGKLLHNCGGPVVANITSVMGSMGENNIGGCPAYRMSKAALNMFTRELAIEEPTLVVLSLHPGWVRTKMGGGQRADIEPRVSAEGILRVIANAKRKDSGKFFRYSGEPVGW